MAWLLSHAWYGRDAGRCRLKLLADSSAKIRRALNLIFGGSPLGDGRKAKESSQPKAGAASGTTREERQRPSNWGHTDSQRIGRRDGG